jgi:5'-3' exonuclease
MGIPHYFQVLLRNYPNILHVARPKRCTDFFVDYNGAIHHAANKVLSEEHQDYEKAVLNASWTYLQDCVGIADPTRMVHVCMDGVAPIAKMCQQRKRRYLSVWKAQKSGDTPKWDRNAISPGTPFMAQLHAHMHHEIRERDIRNNVHYYFSTSDEVGEGEHKIFARIASLQQDSVIIVHGLDADLIMLSLISHKPNIFLMREPSGIYKDMETVDGFMYVEIDHLRKAILEDLRIHYEWPITLGMLDNPYDEGACNVLDTYVTLCSILGNDFLPHPVTLSLKKGGYEKLLQAARGAWERHEVFILPDGKINFQFLADVLVTLAKSEDNDLWKLNEEYLKKRAYENQDDPLDCYPLKNKDPLCKVIYENQPNKWRTFYYKHLFHTRMHDTTVIASACRLFTTGVLWVYRYYKRNPKDHAWYYPFSYAPSLRDLANYVSGLTPTEEDSIYSSFTTPPSKGFVHPHVQLLCIMPSESKNILPKQVQRVMQDDNKGCTYMFPNDYDIQTYMKIHLWECTPVLPVLDISGLEKALT